MVARQSSMKGGHVNPKLAMKPPKLLIAIPCYTGMQAYFTRCVMNLIQEPPANITVRFLPGDSLVSRARNILTADFLLTDCTHLLFIDTDLIFETDHIARLLKHNLAIVGGFYPKKQEGKLEWVCNAYPGGPGVDRRGLQQLCYIGAGFLMVRRDVFLKMIKRFGDEIEYRSDQSGRQEWDFWKVGVHQPSRRYLSEDWFFCQNALDLGYKVYGDSRVILKHVGTAIYPQTVVSLTHALGLDVQKQRAPDAGRT